MQNHKMPNGWMPGVEEIESLARWENPQTGAHAPTPRLGIINHVMQGYQTTMIAWARERPYRTVKSAHFTINRNGRIVQHVSAWDHAWAAVGVCRPTWPLLPPSTNPNRVAINIEWEGFSADPRTYPYDYLYGPLGVPDPNGRPMRPWPQPQIRAATQIHRWLFTEGIVAGLPSPDTITGHFATDACNRPLDPGPYWLQTVRPTLIQALAPSRAPDRQDRTAQDSVQPESVEGPEPHAREDPLILSLSKDAIESIRAQLQTHTAELTALRTLVDNNHHALNARLDRVRDALTP